MLAASSPYFRVFIQPPTHCVSSNTNLIGYSYGTGVVYGLNGQLQFAGPAGGPVIFDPNNGNSPNYNGTTPAINVPGSNSSNPFNPANGNAPGYGGTGTGSPGLGSNGAAPGYGGTGTGSPGLGSNGAAPGYGGTGTGSPGLNAGTGGNDAFSGSGGEPPQQTTTTR